VEKTGLSDTRSSIVEPQDLAWAFWFTLPLYPYNRRRTLRQEIISDSVWTFDQLQGILYVTVPIRMTVIKLDQGGLLVYAPIAPTPECLRLINELVATHGEVKYILLPTVSGLEHKVFVAPFARCFPTAQIWIAPNQWSFPLNLPLSWLGLPRHRTQVLPQNAAEAPFAAEFDYALLNVDLKGRSFGEVALFHRRSQTLLVTDTIVSVPEEPPAIVQLDPYPLLFHAKDRAADAVADTPANRRKGWQRSTLFTFYFRPNSLQTLALAQVLRNASQASDRSPKAYFGLFPFQWQADWQRSFTALRGDGRLLVAPILQTLILNRAPQTVLDWVDHVAEWEFQCLIPAHLDSPIAATPAQFRQAFDFLQPTSELSDRPNQCLPETDLEFLKQIDRWLYKLGITPVPQNKR
jgi:hypothetical protein